MTANERAPTRDALMQGAGVSSRQTRRLNSLKKRVASIASIAYVNNKTAASIASINSLRLKQP